MPFVPDKPPHQTRRFVPDSQAETLPANAGLANFVAGALGAPVDILQGAINAPQMAFGAAATALGRPDLAPTVASDAFGGSESIRRGLRATGVQGLNPDNPSQTTAGKLQYDLVSRGGFIPGGVLPAAGSMIAEKIGGPTWAPIGALVPGATVAAINGISAPSRALARAQNSVRDATLKPAQDAGYVVPPSQVRGGAGEMTLESFAGKAALKQRAELKNQQITNTLVREELGMPANAPITEGALTTLRETASQPYRDVAGLAPVAKTALERLRDVRSAAKDQWRHWDMQGIPDAKRQAVELDAQAAHLEHVLEVVARRFGRPDLVTELRGARTYIAKTYDVERALNIGNGNVDAKILGRALDRGRPLSGNLEIIAKFAEGPGRQVTREASAVPSPGVSALNWPAAAALGMEGLHFFGAPGLAAAAVPFARGGARSLILSSPYQERFARPNYDPIQQQNPLAALLQQSVIANREEQ